MANWAWGLLILLGLDEARLGACWMLETEDDEEGYDEGFLPLF